MNKTYHRPSVLVQDEALPAPPPQPTTADQAAPPPKKSAKRNWIGRKPKVAHQFHCLTLLMTQWLHRWSAGALAALLV